MQELKTELHQIKKLVYSNRNNHQNQEITHKVGGNLCQLFTDKGLTPRVYKEFKKKTPKEQVTQLTHW
jgi:hypothetical protein